MNQAFLDNLAQDTDALHGAGLFKAERVITTPQEASIRVATDGEAGREVINLCANNYLGLANHPALIEAAHEALDRIRLRHGVGALHLRHPDRAQGTRGSYQSVSRHRGHDPVFLLFRRQRRPVRDLLDDKDAVISDALNHASIIDGIRLCKAQRLRYRHNDMADLRDRLAEAADAARD